MHAALLLLADSRLPAGGHAHSGGAEEAVRAGTVTGPDDLARFLRGRLATAGLVAAALAAAACELGSAAIDASERLGGDAGTGEGDPAILPWRRLDAEADARTASPAQREAARTQGRLLVRTARRIWPSPALESLARAVPDGAHHPVALGATAAAAGCDPGQAALAAAYWSVTGPATAAVRLLGLDPVAVHRLLADLAPSLGATARAARTALHTWTTDPEVPWTTDPNAPWTVDPDDRRASSPDSGRATDPDLIGVEFMGDACWAALPATAAPALDLLAENHLRAETRLFVS
ncbi:urease accessory protein UreF [Microtetraspora sp. AC03309]|uniref:urease accessory protein UreF n=1 Tax=Microtetraspora sp. AC03309 TaxID=2779376 RepID=UPI001E46EDE4|nr:urease accessory UreF family protein [Microtetraspora sp. AC03309]MCC5575965.1 urease accessory protein UreF [Microtetraspora sp. AC03309]